MRNITCCGFALCDTRNCDTDNIENSDTEHCNIATSMAIYFVAQRNIEPCDIDNIGNCDTKRCNTAHCNNYNNEFCSIAQCNIERCGTDSLRNGTVNIVTLDTVPLTL